MSILQKVKANFLSIIEVVKEFCAQSFRCLYAFYSEFTVVISKPEQDESSIGIGKSTVGRPKTDWQCTLSVPTSCQLALNRNGFGQQGNIFE